MGDTMLGYDMLNDDTSDGLLSLHELSDLVSAGASAASQGGTVASCVRSREVQEFGATNWKTVTYTKFLALGQRRSPSMSGSFDAWLSATGSTGVNGRLEQQLGRDCLPLRHIDLPDSDALLPDDCAPDFDGFDLTAAYSRSSTDSGTTTLASATSCAHSSAANSGNDLTSLVQTNSPGSPQPSLLPPPMNGLHFDCLPDTEDTTWLGFDSEVSGLGRSLDSCPIEPAVRRVLLGRPCSPELPECSRGRAGGCMYLIATGGLEAQSGLRFASGNVPDAASIGLLPGGSSGSGAGACAHVPKGLYPPAFRGTLTARLAAERMQPKSCPQPASVLPGWPMPTSHLPQLISPVPVRGAPQPLTDFLALGDSDDLPAAFLSAPPRSTQSGRLERPGDAGSAPDSASCSSQAPSDAAAASAQVHVPLILPTAAPAPTAQVPEAPATAAAAAFQAGARESAVWASSFADLCCSKHDAGRSLLDEVVHGGSPRGSRGALHALAACRFPADGCSGITAAASVPATVPSPQGAEALVGEPPSADAGSGGAEALGALPLDASSHRRRIWLPGSPYDCMGAAASAMAESHSREESGQVGGGGNHLGPMEKAELEDLRAAPTWALLLVLAERCAHGYTRMHASALWAAMLPWSAMVSFVQRLLLPGPSAAGNQRPLVRLSPTTPVRCLEELADVPVREVP